LAYPQAVLYT